MIRWSMVTGVSLIAFAGVGCISRGVEIKDLEVKPSLEDKKDDGSVYTPETQSILRGKHVLESVDGMDIQIDSNDEATVVLKSSKNGETVRYNSIPIDTLVPRLHYSPASPPDEFDAFNLMLAEYSRNSIDFPRGTKSDSMTHFESSFDEVSAPWTLNSDYEFKANPRYMPSRMSLTNNCLGPGLWELNATDTAGEIFHAWFGFPGDRYMQLVAQVNGLPREFVEKAVIFRKEDAPVDLDRLRTIKESIGTGTVVLAPDSRAGYSSQGSRRKLGRGFAMVEKDGKLVKPEKLSDLTSSVSHLSEFQEPGRYSFKVRKPFDMSFLAKAKGAEFFLVEPKTSYVDFNGQGGKRAENADQTEYLELHVTLENETLVFGNLPISLLVPTEDFTLHGFGVGILSAGEPTEQRKLWFERGPLPSFGYLIHEKDGKTMGVNTHERGLEQVFLRTRFEKGVPHIEVILTSYERMVDLVKYEITVPSGLVERLNQARLRYIPPIYRTYKDDNLR